MMSRLPSLAEPLHVSHHSCREPAAWRGQFGLERTWAERPEGREVLDGALV